MSRKYKFRNKEGLYFVSFATVYWIDLFVRERYSSIITDSLDYCRKNKGLELYCWCLMPSHVHLIFRAKDGNPEILLGRVKEFTSKKIQTTLKEDLQESRREWILELMGRAAEQSSNVKGLQLWQHHNKPIELWSDEVIEQKINYIHNNPVVAGFVTQPEHWKYSSAVNYSDEKGVIEIDEM